MLDRVPLGCARRVVGDGHAETVALGELLLQATLPRTTTGAVAAAGRRRRAVTAVARGTPLSRIAGLDEATAPAAYCVRKDAERCLKSAPIDPRARPQILRELKQLATGVSRFRRPGPVSGVRGRARITSHFGASYSCRARLARREEGASGDIRPAEQKPSAAPDGMHRRPEGGTSISVRVLRGSFGDAGSHSFSGYRWRP